MRCHADVAKLADAQVSGSCGRPWGFKSLRPHHNIYCDFHQGISIDVYFLENLKKKNLYGKECIMKVVQKQRNSKMCIMCGLDNDYGVQAPFTAWKTAA